MAGASSGGGSAGTAVGGVERDECLLGSSLLCLGWGKGGCIAPAGDLGDRGVQHTAGPGECALRRAALNAGELAQARGYPFRVGGLSERSDVAC
jgi:hypothetical protein